MRSKLTILALIALLCVSTSIQTVAAGPDDGNQVISVYETIKDAAEARRDELLYLLEEDISTQVMDSLRAALDSMKLAEDTSQSDPGASLYHYMDALRLFRETWALYLEENKEGASSSFSTFEEAPEIIEIPKNLDKEIKETKEKLLIKFQENIVKQYTKIVDDVEEIVDLIPGEDNKKIQSVVNKAQKKLDDLSTKITQGHFEDVIDSLEDEPVPFHEDFENLSDKEAKETLKTIARMGHEEYKTEVKMNKKADNGEDASEEEEELHKINERIDNIKKEFKEKVAKLNNRRTPRIKVTDKVEETEEPEVFTTFTEDEDKLEKEEDKLEDELEKEEDKLEDKLDKEEEKEEDDLEKEEDKLDKEEEKEEDEDEDD